jgi:hypothetical protein
VLAACLAVGCGDPIDAGDDVADALADLPYAIELRDGKDSLVLGTATEPRTGAVMRFAVAPDGETSKVEHALGKGNYVVAYSYFSFGNNFNAVGKRGSVEMAVSVEDALCEHATGDPCPGP